MPITSLKNYKPFIIPVFLPNAGCPHQCVFCNQHVITGQHKNPDIEEINEKINTFLSYKNKIQNVQISFFGGNFLGLPNDYIRSLLFEAHKFIDRGLVESIRFSTRPDTITIDKLDIIKDFKVSTIELGVQSMRDDILALSKRGHTSIDTENAVILLKKRNYRTGLQMMVGLPGDNEEGAMFTGRKITALLPDFVRIYPALVLENSPLADLYKKGAYKPLSLENCVSTVKMLYMLFRQNEIPVIRMGLQASEDLDCGSFVLAGPYHPAFGHLVYSAIFLDMAKKALELKEHLPETIIIKVHPNSVSRMHGQNNSNIKIIKKMFNISSLNIISDLSVGKENIKIKNF